MHAGRHTRLVNMFIGFCHNTRAWPNILCQLGYEVQLIEQAVSLESAKKTVPDVVAVSNKLLHAIVADCKSGNNIDADQNGRYGQLASSNLAYYVDVYDSKRLTHIVCYVDNEANHAFLEPHTTLPFITFGQDMIQAKGDFGNEETNKELHGSVSLVGMKEPTGYYPFSPDDEDNFIMPHILVGLVSHLTKRQRSPTKIRDPAIAREILESIHSCYSVMSTGHRKNLIRRIQRIIDVSLGSNKKFKDQISKIESGEYNVGTLKSLKDACMEIISGIEHQRRVDDFRPN